MKLTSRIFNIALCMTMLWCFTGMAQADSAYTEYKQLRSSYDLGLPFSPQAKVRFDLLSERYGDRDRDGELDERGGPDNYGYHWVDNMGGDTASYEWIELRGDNEATWPTFDNPDDAGVTISLGFPFPFYGATYDQVRINSNGLLEFSTSAGAWSNQCLPAANVAGPAIFGFWDDLDMSHGGNGENVDNTIAYRNFANYTVIEFCSTGHADFANTPDDSYKFEMILYASGRIKFQYESMLFVDYVETQTIGIQSGSAGPSLEYVCDNTGMQPQSGLAVLFYVSATGQLNGTVSSDLGLMLSRAAISIEGTQMFTHTDGAGEFFFPNAPVGTYDVSASLLGYEPASVTDVVIEADNATTIQLEMNTLSAVTIASTHAPIAIVDLDTVTATIDVVATIDIDAVGVRINNLQHTYVDDLGLWLESPWGERVLLSFRHGGSADNYMNTQLDDLALRPISEANAPFTGRFLPDEPLTSLAGNSSYGIWTLIIYDHANQDQGTLNSWSLIVVGEMSVHGTLAGQITSSETGTGLEGAAVTVEALGARAVTDENGDFTLDLPEGEWDVSVVMDGYCEYTAEGFEISNGITSEFDYALSAADGEASVESLTEESTVGLITTTAFEFENTGACDLAWTAVATSSGWLSISPQTGTLAVGETQTFTVTYDAAGMDVGQYDGEITIHSNGLFSPETVEVTLDLASDGVGNPVLPSKFALRGNFPNPFNATTEIRFDVPQLARVSIVIYNLLGQEVRTLLDGTMTVGEHSIYWDGRDSRGVDLSTGLYIIQMKAEGLAFTGKSILIR